MKQLLLIFAVSCLLFFPSRVFAGFFGVLSRVEGFYPQKGVKIEVFPTELASGKRWNLGSEAEETVIELSREDEGVFKTWLEDLWMEGHRDIFFRYWNNERLREIMVDHIRMDHLIDNPELLIKWCEEIRLQRGLRDGLDRFEEFILLTYQKYEISPGGIDDDFNYDPFWQTALKACRKNNDFSQEFQQTVRRVLPAQLSVRWR